jgi:small-conductance mechanosensitive channel
LLLFPFLAAPVRGAQTQTPAAIPSTSANNTKTPEGADAPVLNPADSTDSAIPLPQIADRAQELDRLLQEISSQLTPKVELQETAKRADSQTEEIHKRVLQTRDILTGATSPLELEDEQRYWGSRSLEFAAQRKLLTELAAKLEEQIKMLEVQQKEWGATWDQVHNSSGIETVVERVKQELHGIQTTRARAQEQLNLVLTLQNQVSRQDQQISDTLLRVRQAREQKRSRLLEPDSRPLWEARELRQFDQTVAPLFRRSFDRSLGSAWEFLRAQKFAIFTLLASYLLALLGTYKLRSSVALGTGPEPSPKALQILDAPYSVALLVALLGTGEFIASAPIGIAFFFYLLYLIPVLRLLAPLTKPNLRVLLYLLATFYVLEGLYLLVQLPPLLRREAYTLMIVAALVSFVWLGRPSRLGPLLPLVMKQIRNRSILVMIGIRAGLLVLTGSLVANIFGYVSLSQVLGLTALVGPFVAAALYCGARVLTLLLSAVMHTNLVEAFPETRREAVERWGGRLLAAGALLLWLKAMLQLLTIYESVMGAVSTMLQYPIGFEKVHFTLGGTLTVLLIMLVGYAFANSFTFLLKKVVLPKLPLQRGLPYAISTITYYVLLTLIALAALSAAGVELNKFTVLTGALGVGLGFGLQNIVNNFVSGLILLFERPIHVGDTVDIGGLVGIVRRIGARSSTVLTYQGAEVIVPNSNLLSNQVINWTLSSQWRRVDVPVRVAYGTDPERVIKLLVGVAESHPGVLLVRPPMAFFLGFGASSLNFELRFWCAQQDFWFQLQSDVTVAVAKTLREANIEVPFPQQDLHVRSIDASIAESLANNGVRTAPSVSAAERSVRS